jgi:hydroxymethylglutaryl-CoA lyase
MQMPKMVEIVEVGPRDGLQSIEVDVPTEKKVALINALSRAGVRRIEATSFSHPAVIPQLKDAEEVLGRLEHPPGVRLMALVPNMRGYERARSSHVDEVALVVAATETLNQKNVRLSVADSLRQFATIIARAKEDGLRVRGSIGASFGCPYEGPVASERVIAVAERLFDMGADEVMFADTIGCANPAQTYDLLARARQQWPQRPLAAHFHDTRHMALANVLAALHAGITIFDTSIGGLGGCPFSPGAAGNVATEKVVFMLHEMGIETGINYEHLLECARMAVALTMPKA